jgi:predicted small lipoprotein YifL
MRKVVALAAVVLLAGCGEKKPAATPAADSAAATQPAATDTTHKTDSTMARDTSHSM